MRKSPSSKITSRNRQVQDAPATPTRMLPNESRRLGQRQNADIAYGETSKLSASRSIATVSIDGAWLHLRSIHGRHPGADRRRAGAGAGPCSLRHSRHHLLGRDRCLLAGSTSPDAETFAAFRRVLVEGGLILGSLLTQCWIVLKIGLKRVYVRYRFISCRY